MGPEAGLTEPHLPPGETHLFAFVNESNFKQDINIGGTEVGNRGRVRKETGVQASNGDDFAHVRSQRKCKSDKCFFRQVTCLRSSLMVRIQCRTPSSVLPRRHLAVQLSTGRHIDGCWTRMGFRRPLAVEKELEARLARK